jgi:DNA gyrase subunit B
VAAYDPDANIVAQLGELNLSQDLLFPDVVVLSEQVDDLSIEIALQWTKGVTEQICSYANGSPTTQGGMHVEGFSKALTEVVKAHASSRGLPDSTSVSLLGGDIREGLRAIIRMRCDDPCFEPINDDGINGRRLGSVRIREFVYWATSKHLSSWLDEHPSEATLIVHKSISAAHDRVLPRSQWDQGRGR